MITTADREAKLTLIGAVLIKFATGLAAIWGTCNVYFFSYLKHHGEVVDIKTNSILLLCALIPTCLAVLLSNPFARLVGYKTAVRICAIVFVISPLMINFTFSTSMFALFWLVIPLSCFCLGAIPVLNCLWTHFRKDLSKISGVAVMAFSIGMIFWNLVFLFIVNPDNIGAEID
jgi:MFS family permease